jgi:hypothetical protein
MTRSPSCGRFAMPAWQPARWTSDPFDSGMGITILPASVVKHRVASVVACEILDRIPMFEIGIAVSKRFRTAVVDNLRFFALRTLGHSRKSLSVDRS